MSKIENGLSLMNSGRVSLGVLVVLLVIAGLAAWGWWATRPKPVDVVVVKVERGTVEKTVANTRAGTVTACRRARLSPSTGGQIAVLPVKEGDQVKEGQLLLELWNKDIKAERALAEQEATSAAATARSICISADQARREANRVGKLLARTLVSEDTVDQANSTADAGQADCESAQASAAVRKARVGVISATIEKTQLFAPFAGVVAEINGEMNEYVTPSPVGVATQPAIDLIDNGCFYMAGPIDEVDVAGVKVDQPARVTLDAFDERRFEGRVQRISDYVLDVEKQARTVEVEIEFVNPEDIDELLAGYSADVEIILETRAETLRIPTEAVVNSDQVYVFDADGELIERRTIKAGVANWDHTEILEGVEEGELVVTSVDRDGVADGVPARLDPDAGE